MKEKNIYIKIFGFSIGENLFPKVSGSGMLLDWT